MHTVERFSSFDPLIGIILVLPAEHHSLWRQLCEEHSFGVSHRVVTGGEERFHSVRAGLECVKEDLLTGINGGTGSGASGRDGAVSGVDRGPADSQAAIHDGVRNEEAPLHGDVLIPIHDGVRNEEAPVRGDVLIAIHDGVRNEEAPVRGDVLIAIHDGVRPLVSHDTIWRCFSDAEEFGNAVPFIEPADSVRVLDGDESRPVPRSEVRLIQTPQVFRGSVIIKAYDRDFDPSFTDDATVAEADGVKIHLTHGNRENLKITTPEDLAVAATLAGMLRQ